MAQLKFGSAGVTTNEIDLSGPLTVQPVGVPAGVIGTAKKGKAFVPVTVAVQSDFDAKFGKTDGIKFGPLAVNEWLKNAQALTYLRVLGVGDGKKRSTTGTNAGTVTSAGFVVGEQQPLDSSDGNLSANPYANSGGVPGRLYFLGTFMSESAGSTVFSQAGVQTSTTAIPIVRGMVMAPSGVILRLSSSISGANDAPATSYVANSNTTTSGAIYGAVTLLQGTTSKQEFVMLLNGHKGTDPLYPNVLTASFDMTAPNYFVNVFNTDPYKIQQAGHYLYANWDIYPATAAVTGAGVVSGVFGAGGSQVAATGKEVCAFLTTGSLDRNVGSSIVPNYENWENRFTNARSPWVVSQRFGGTPVNLFRIHCLDDGAGVSSLFKVSIENLTPSSDPLYKYGSFDVVLRDWADNDANVVPLEAWRGVNLDPTSDRYISKVIGDANAFFDFDRNEASQKLVIEGAYDNMSNYVRVEVSSDVELGFVDPTALPFGVRGVAHLVTSGSAPLTSPTPELSTLFGSSTNVLKRAITPPLPMRKDITQGTGQTLYADSQLYWGTHFEHVTSTTTQNASTLVNDTLKSFAKYYPDFMSSSVDVVVGDNNGTADTAENGILDADRFCRNFFTLENIKVVTGSNALADNQEWDSATYVRDGAITADESAKTRRLTTSDLTQANRKYLKFSFIVQGGFDGVNIFNQNEAEINNVAVLQDMAATNRNTVNGPNVKAYMKAIDIMKNVDDVDVQLLTIPGIRHSVITNYALAAVEDRFDAMLIMDVEQKNAVGTTITSSLDQPSVSQVVQTFRDRNVDSSFGAAYFPDVIVTDPNTQTNVVAPPSVAVLGAFALNDSVGHPWFAPAGFTRGALPSVLEAQVKLKKQNMDDLYDVNINPLVAFPGSAPQGGGTNPKGGVVVWGQRTLQLAASALDRVNVRRLLIELRRQVRQVARTIIFEPNREATLARFSSAVDPKLRRIQGLAGVEKYKIVIDSSTTTQLDVMNSTIRGKIFVVPTKVTEYVSLDFVVTNQIEGT